MNNLRTIRIFTAIIFFVATIAYLFLGNGINPMAEISEKVQIIPSALLLTIGATGFWLAATFVFGRIYCSSVCPVGTLQDSATWLRHRLNRIPRIAELRISHYRRPVFSGFRYRHPSRWKGIILLIYIIILLLGMTAVASLLEPWNIVRLASRAVNPENSAPGKILILSGNILLGSVIGFLILFLIWIWALLDGRRFCTEVCPIGTTLGYISRYARWQIEFDPDKCIGCMRCEEICKSSAVKVVSRYVDNEKCVRCFDCLRVCENDAIRFSRDRTRRATPLLHRRALR